MSIIFSKVGIQQSILIFFSFLLLFILSRQVPFDSFSFIMNLSLGAILLLSFKDIANRLKRNSDFLLLFTVSVSLLVLAFFYSLFLQNDFGNVLRFFIVFGFVAISYFIELPRKVLYIFVYLMVFHAVLIILFSLYLTLFFDIDSYLPIRFFFTEKGWGDVFTYNGWFYRIQIKGNALLPVAFFTTFYVSFPRRTLIRLLLFLGCIYAGNIAYIVVVFFFLVGFFLKTTSLNLLMKRVVVLLLFFIISVFPVYQYFIKETLELKSDSSLPTRVDQVNVLMDDLSENDFYLIFGRGIGHTIEKISPYRDYRGNIYFELQSLYVLNQIGVLGFIFFIFYNIYMSLRLYNGGLLFFYLCYIIYAFTNPYIFDTNHIVVILLLNIIQSNEIKKSCRHYNLV